MTSIRHNASIDDQPDRPGDDVYLDAAREAILAIGWSRTTLTDIARRAGVSRMTLYRRWPDTQTLLADLMTREWAQVVQRATRADLTETIVATVRALRESDLVRRIVDVDPEVLLPYLLQRPGRSQEHIVDLTAAAIESGQRDGSVRAGEPATMASTLILAAHGFLLSAHTMRQDVAALDDELAVLIEGYLTPVSPEAP